MSHYLQQILNVDGAECDPYTCCITLKVLIQIPYCMKRELGLASFIPKLSHNKDIFVNYKQFDHPLNEVHAPWWFSFVVNSCCQILFSASVFMASCLLVQSLVLPPISRCMNLRSIF